MMKLPEINHVIIENISPSIECGRFPIKRTVGDTLKVSADIISHGHESLVAYLLYRKKGDVDFLEKKMEHQHNDRYHAEFELDENTTYEYTAFAYRDLFLSWRADLKKRVEAGLDVSSELLEGREIIVQTAKRAKNDDRHLIDEVIEKLDERVDAKTPEVKALALVEDLATKKVKGIDDEIKKLRSLLGRLAKNKDHYSAQALDRSILNALFEPRFEKQMLRYADRHYSGQHPQILSVKVDRRAAEFSTWYEMWARSQGKIAGQSATFSDMTARLAEIKKMGFDVIYLPPIHPIGETNRKGPNNSLQCPDGSPGCPYAIGNKKGGHMSIDEDLGTLSDFRAFVKACHKRGMELAMDYALQASPDHPWVKAHPDWFYHRPDGTIKYAENPPKKYEDVYPLNFETNDREGLWNACLEILLFWIDEGVKIFRVDNPHTKPIEFWAWLIEKVHQDHPDVIFLAEAFTRPKIMRALAKAGFSQSYTYFTWRNFKDELQEYFEELTQSEAAEYLKGNLFTNTPDILPQMLQNAPRSAFMIRATLAATLSSVWGMYNGFELCEGRAIEGKEEYIDSEKYDYKVWDWNRPGHIKDYIAKLNQARHGEKALQSYRNLRFCQTDNDQVLAYMKISDDRSSSMIIVVNLDPYHAQESNLYLDLDALSIEKNDHYQMYDLLSDERYIWQGEKNFIRLDPNVRVAHIFRLLRWSHRENDFDYFI